MELPVTDTPVLDHSNDATIVARVAANLDARGWTRVDPATIAPDVDVVVYASLGPSLLYVSYPFFDGFPGWAGFAGYDNSWGVFYPWSRPGRRVLIEQGSVRIDMLDARNPDTGEQAAALVVERGDERGAEQQRLQPPARRAGHRRRVRAVAVPLRPPCARSLDFASRSSCSWLPASALAQSHFRLSYEMAVPYGPTPRLHRSLQQPRGAPRRLPGAVPGLSSRALAGLEPLQRRQARHPDGQRRAAGQREAVPLPERHPRHGRLRLPHPAPRRRANLHRGQRRRGDTSSAWSTWGCSSTRGPSGSGG